MDRVQRHHVTAAGDHPHSPEMLDGFISIVEQYLENATNPGFEASLRQHLAKLHEQRDALSAAH